MANEGLLVAQGSPLAGRRADLLLALTAAQATRGHLAAATSGLTEAEGIFRELRKKRPRCLALANIAELLTWQGEPVQARQRAHIAVQVATELDYKLGQTAAMRAMAVAALDLGLYADAQAGLNTALRIARTIDLSEEIVACLSALTQLCVEQGDATGARHHAANGLEVASDRDPERYAPLLRAHLARALAESRPDEARVALGLAEEALVELPVPRRTQVELALASACVALGEHERAEQHARQVIQTAGSRGFQLLALEARAILAHVCEPHDAHTHRQAGQDLAKDFTTGLAPDMVAGFVSRPWLQWLDDPEN
jgi:tetratricopeptide (TPR) repeat protein